MKKFLFAIFFAIAGLFALGASSQTIWIGTEWINYGSVIQSENLKSNLDYLLENKVYKPQNCSGSDKRLVWNDDQWGCQTDSGVVNDPEFESCTIKDRTVAHEGVIVTYQEPTVAYGETCQSETRTCNDGTLTGDYEFVTCTVGEPDSCVLEGIEISHDESVTRYQSATVEDPAACQSETRTCNNGDLSGSFTATSCEVIVEPTACTGVWQDIGEPYDCEQNDQCSGPLPWQTYIGKRCKQKQTFSVTQQASGGGSLCLYADGSEREIKRNYCGADHIQESFIAGTQVLTPAGPVAIETIAVGDLVVGSAGLNTVLELKRSAGPKELFSINGSNHFVTEGHPFMTQDGWKAFNVESARMLNPNLSIGQLEIGDTLIKASGTMEILENYQSIKKQVSVYNFEVSGTRDYYADDYLVHNK